MLRAALAIALLTGCGLHRSNEPKPLTAEREVDARTIRSVRGVQVAFALRYVGAHDGAPLLTLWLRNEGDDAVAIDVGRLRVRGYTATSSRALQLQDPRGELEPLHVDPGAFGRERIRLTDLGNTKDGPLRRVCVELDRLFPDDHVPFAPVCFTPTDEPDWQVSP